MGASMWWINGREERARQKLLQLRERNGFIQIFDLYQALYEITSSNYPGEEHARILACALDVLTVQEYKPVAQEIRHAMDGALRSVLHRAQEMTQASLGTVGDAGTAGIGPIRYESFVHPALIGQALAWAPQPPEPDQPLFDV